MSTSTNKMTHLALRPVLGWLARRMPMPADGPREAYIAAPRTAIATGQIRLHYQPKLATGSGRPVGLEALVPRQHPERGLLGAGEIVPLAEGGALPEELNGCVLR